MGVQALLLTLWTEEGAAFLFFSAYFDHASLLAQRLSLRIEQNFFQGHSFITSTCFRWLQGSNSPWSGGKNSGVQFSAKFIKINFTEKLERNLTKRLSDSESAPPVYPDSGIRFFVSRHIFFLSACVIIQLPTVKRFERPFDLTLSRMAQELNFWLLFPQLSPSIRGLGEIFQKE